MASKNAFDATLDANNQIKVNTFDWTAANNLTTQIGRITPVFCELVPSKGSVRIKPTFGLQMMPMVFPIQTRLKARISYYKYPLRALWQGYRDFIGNFDPDLEEEPYLNINTQERLQKMASTGSLGDYLGLPTTQVGDYSSSIMLPTGSHNHMRNVYLMPELMDSNDAPGHTYDQLVSQRTNTQPSTAPSYTTTWAHFFDVNVVDDSMCHLVVNYNFDSRFSLSTLSPVHVLIWDAASSASISTSLTDVIAISQQLTATIPDSFVGKNVHVAIIYQFDIDSNPSIDGVITTYTDPSVNETYYVMRSSVASVNIGSAVQDLTLVTSPWYNSNSSSKNNQIKLSSYAFRAYEGIYNAYWRDNRNNPYYINGKVSYNQWIPSYAGGEDNNLYELRYANWEKDFLTTAVQSPQQGQAPLVGITTYTDVVSYTDDSGETKFKEVTKTALSDGEGKNYAVSFESDEDGLKGVEYVELDNGVRVRQPRNLIDVATSGISIADLRNVNAYQKFLELNMRKGYSYRDIIKGRFDVNVRYDDLLLPEFIGGFSRDIDMNAITQTVDQDSDGSGTYAKALGSQSGVAGVRGSSEHSIECFCDEESIVIGLLVVTPVPVYTQLLPKHFTYRGLLEHYQPEFNHIGFQPITYKEVCPIQAYNEDPASLTQTFGYNRPWYEYVQKYDSAHGLFRTNLSNFLMHRVFNSKPELSQSFLVIDPEQVTDVFSVTETTDKIYGQVWHQCTAKLPISRVAIPRLD